MLQYKHANEKRLQLKICSARTVKLGNPFWVLTLQYKYNTDALPMEKKLEIRMKQLKTPRQRLALLLISTGHNATI